MGDFLPETLNVWSASTSSNRDHIAQILRIEQSFGDLEVCPWSLRCKKSIAIPRISEDNLGIVFYRYAPPVSLSGGGIAMFRGLQAFLLSILLVVPASAATVTIEAVLDVRAASVFPATSSPAVPGRPSQFVFRGDNPMPPPTINNAGELVFRARSALNSNTNTGTALGLYAKRPGFPLAVLVDSTEVSPGVPTFAVPGRPANNRFTGFEPPLLNNAGDVVFLASFTSPGTTPSSGTGVYATKTTGGPIVRITDTFTAVPGHPTGSFTTFNSGLSSVALTTVLNDLGQVAYRAQFLITGNSTQRTGLFGSSVAGGPGANLADSVGASGPVSVPVGVNDFFNEIRFAVALNNLGTVAFSAGMPGGIINRGGIYTVPVGGGSITTVAIQGQPVPGRLGETFQGTFEPGGHNIDINDSGIVIFRNQYRGVFSPPSEAGVYAATPSGAGYIHTRIADTQPGLTVPGEPAGAEFLGMLVPSINDSAMVAPYATVSPGSPTPNQQGIYYTDTDGTPISVVVNLNTPPPGQVAPVGGFPRFTGFVQSNGALGALNNLGNLTFLGNGNPTSTTSFRGVYFFDVCTPELVRISDSTISVSQLGGSVNNGYDIWQVESHAGMYRSINDDNDVAFAAQFNNFDYGLYIAHIQTGSGGGQLNITCPPNVVAECPVDSDPSATGTATATGCGDITVTFSDAPTAGCGGTTSITRTWTADNGSTTASCVQTITETDTTGPVLSGVPGDAMVQCDALPPTPSVTASDACEGSVSVTFSESQVAGSCPGTYVLTRTWTATDGCGNSSSASQDVAVMDTVDPVLVGVPGDVSVECDAVPSPATVTASDTCAVNVPVTFMETQTNGSCPDEFTLTRTWSAVDDCANDVTAMQLVSVDDTTPPTINCPAHASLECPADTSVSAQGSATGADNCSTPSISSSDSTMQGCGTTETITRTWTAMDDCSNSAACDQYVAVVDTTAPTMTVDTTPITVTDTNCDGSEIVTLPTGTANDACDGPRPVSDDAPSSFPAGQTTTVTYSALDACGNTSTAQLDVTVQYGANIAVRAERHTVGSGPHPGSTKVPLVGILVCAYDKSDGSCARTICGGISHQNYQCILDSCAATGCGTTDNNGEVVLNLPPGDYVVISGDATKTVLPDPLGVSASDLVCGETKQKYLQQIVRADGSKKSAKYTVLTGSQLLIIEPEFIVWDDTEQLYPFVFESIGEWGVTASVTPPDGFVADYEALSAEVDNELESVQFTITELGSDLVPTKTTFQTVHKGVRRTVRSSVDIRLTPDYARSRGFDVETLRAKGLIVDRVERVEPVARPPVDKTQRLPSPR